jgi:adenine deaminase
METTYRGIVVDIEKRRRFKGEVGVKEGKIEYIRECEHNEESFILPGFVDSHVHIESSMAVPSVFAEMVIPRGTVAVVSDPHEIANVMGVPGIDFMIENAKQVPLKIYFGVPSCVPATPFESSGAEINAETVEKLLKRNDLYYLSEMMNFPGVLQKMPEVMQKIEAAIKQHKRVDGHAPGLRGKEAKMYAEAGISSDHECTNREEAVDKITAGMKIAIREGSAAKNFDALYSLIDQYPDHVMLCTDDSHPETLLEEGHIDKIIRKGLGKGIDIYHLLQAATINPVKHYNLNVGLLKEGDPADFIVVEDLENFKVRETIIDGIPVYQNQAIQFKSAPSKPMNVFNRKKITREQIEIKAKTEKIRVMEVSDGSLYTGQTVEKATVKEGKVISDPQRDILKMVVMSRYKNEPVQIGFIKNFQLKKGAIASSIAHDSHNIIAVGTTDDDILAVVNKLIECKGGIVVGNTKNQMAMPLEIGGIMTQKSGREIADRYQQLMKKTREYGCTLNSPLMTLAFMSLLVIPELKLGDKGLFDVNKFEFVDVFV